MIEERRCDAEVVYAALERLQIPYQKKEHAPIYTTEDAVRLGTDFPGLCVKVLFLRDKKEKQRYYLALVEDHKRLDFKAFSRISGCQKPAFADEDQLWEKLRLIPGGVSPFGLLHDQEHRVVVVLDACFSNNPPDTLVNFHPNVNTATVAIRVDDFLRFLVACGNPVIYEAE